MESRRAEAARMRCRLQLTISVLNCDRASTRPSSSVTVTQMSAKHVRYFSVHKSLSPL